MPAKIKKENLPQKICARCNRYFSWRKKWQKTWDEVKFCSKGCQKHKNQK